MKKNATNYQLYVDKNGELFTGEYKETIDTRVISFGNVECNLSTNDGYTLLTNTGFVRNGRPCGKWVREAKKFDNKDNLKGVDREENEYEIVGNHYYLKSSKTYADDKLLSEQDYLPIYDADDDSLQVYSDAMKYVYHHNEGFSRTENYTYSEDGMKCIEQSILERQGFITKEETTWASKTKPIKYGYKFMERVTNKLNTITEDGKKVGECSVHYVNDKTIIDSLEIYYDNGRKMIYGVCCPDDDTSFMLTLFERDGETVKKKGIVAMKDIAGLDQHSIIWSREENTFDNFIENIKELLD